MKTLTKTLFILWLATLCGATAGQYHQNDQVDRVSNGSADLAMTDGCVADFTFSLDSLTSNPFLYHFKDLSSGTINAWYWDFGDGNHSTEPNPSHQYEDGAAYKVCLHVADLNDTAACSDQICKEITTVQYFSLGGLVYAGEYPLNNPVNHGDVGVASLYRMTNEQVEFVEDQYFQDYGYYWFGFLVPGEYLLKISLTPESPSFPHYFTTYFGDEIAWTKAERIIITNSDNFDAEVHLRPVEGSSTGNGIIRGYVNFEQGNQYSPPPPMAQTTVILSDQDHEPLLFTHPDATGYFEFSGIGFDSYFLSADATGKPATAVSVTLSQSNPLVEGINLTVFGGNVNHIPEAFKDGMMLTRVFPNPVKEQLNARIYSGVLSDISIKVFDVNGKVHYSQEGKFISGFNDLFLPVSTLLPGIYFLVLQPQGNYIPVTAKFMKL